MSDDKYRNIERSKPTRAAARSVNSTAGMPLGLDRLFRTKRHVYLGLGVFFVAGALIGGYLGSLTRDNLEEKQRHKAAEEKAPPKPDVAKVGSARVRTYAYSTPGPDQKSKETEAAAVEEPRTTAPHPSEKPKVDTPAVPLPNQSQIALRPPTVGSAPAVSTIVIVIDDLGIDQRRTKKVIALPGPLTLAFLPYGYNLKTLTASAVANSHELLVHLPMQPQAVDADPGPNALLRSLSETEIRNRIEWSLSRFDGFVGINNHMGSDFTTWERGMSVVMQEIKARGLLYLDSLTSAKSVAKKTALANGLSVLTRDVFLDNETDLDRIRSRLSELEAISRRRGYAIGIGHPYDQTIEALSEWSKNLESRGFKLIALSGLLSK